MNIFFDTETGPIRPGDICPPVSCGTFAWDEGGQVKTLILNYEPALDFIEKCLDDDDIILVGHNTPFDLAVACRERHRLLAKSYRKYEIGKARDTLIQQQQIDIATGEMKFHVDEDGEPKRTSYGLAALSYRLNKKFVKKDDTPRLLYGSMRDIPVESWPVDFREYAINDAVITKEVYETQMKICGVDEIPNITEQFKASWALHLMSIWGVRTDDAAVKELKKELETDLEEMMETLRRAGRMDGEAFIPLIRQVKKAGVADDVRSMKEIRRKVEESFRSSGRDVPVTSPSKRFPLGQIATDKKTMLDSGDPDLKLLSEAGGTEKLLSTYIPVLEAGTVVPINAHFNTLVETGRTSCRKPNWQNPPRKGKVREGVRPRKDNVIISDDFSTIEMRALAQVKCDWFGDCRMAQVLRSGEDLHLTLAAQLLGISVEECVRRAKLGDAEVEDARQLAKPANFGFPGGCSAKTFMAYAEGFGMKVSLEKAQQIHAAFFEAWPEMRRYFQVIERIADEGTLVQARSGRVRRGASYCAAANSFFQGLAADGCKAALWEVSKECYTDESSALYGTRPIIFMHDEIIAETPFDPGNLKQSSDAALRMSLVMRTAMEKWIPDVPIVTQPVMTRRWYKGAKPAYVDGVLVPSKPDVIYSDGHKRTVWIPDLGE